MLASLALGDLLHRTAVRLLNKLGLVCGEVEEAIYGLTAVSEVAVLDVPDPYWIEAVAALTATDVIAHCRQTLAGFKLPKHVHFASTLPKNASCKILKRDLRLRWIQEQARRAEA